MPITATFLIYCVLLALVRRGWPAAPMFYQGIVLAIVVTLGFGIFHRWRLGQHLAFRDGLLVFLLCYAFMFTVPTTVDRAYSVAMLRELGNAPNGMSQTDLETFFRERFIQQGGVSRRIEEQTQSGTIEFDGESVKLTDRGRWLTRLFAWNCIVFTCQQN